MNALRQITIAMADDHAMLRKGLIRLLLLGGTFQSIFDVDSGDEVIEQMRKHKIPDVLILDINMPGKDGFQTAEWVSRHFPQVKILALSMFSDESTILKIIQCGARGYITKNSEPEKLTEAITTIYEKGTYLPDSLSIKLFAGIRNNLFISAEKLPVLNDKEKLFLSLLCKELSYPQIAEKMFLSPRTIEDYRKNLTRKLKVKGKSGLIVYAINNGVN